MRVGMVSALWVLLPLLYSPRPASAQSNPVSPQLPSLAKLSELPKGGESARVGSRTDFADEPKSGLRSFRNFLIQQEGASAMGIQSPVEASRCAHILIYQAPIMDSKTIKEVPREFSSNMPTLEALQPCCRDFCRVMVIPQMSPFVGPGRTPAPNPRMPSFGIRP
jgi:hypothetical protein